ncbi:MAG TPA: hypothetical protein VKE51_28095 [Vicinamibacterales bacterium]|nr:hypothetical protein [Vicinamibacterales bacterium]
MAPPDFSGVWELNLENSHLKGPVPRRIAVTIQHEGNSVHQLVLVVSASGDEQRNELTFQTTGIATPVVFGNHVGETSAHWQGSTLIVETRLTAGGRELHFRDHWSLSRDGTVLTMAHPDDEFAGQVSVLERAPTESSADG